MAVSVNDGKDLVVPVIHNAEELNLLGLTRALTDLAERGRTKQLTADEMSGGTFSLTNPGGFGTLLGTPIIPPPQVAILGVNAIVKRPVVVTDELGSDSIAIRQIMLLALSYDHRLVDGAYAAQFLALVKQHLETWGAAEYRSLRVGLNERGVWGVWSERGCRPARRTGGTPFQEPGGGPAKPHSALAARLGSDPNRASERAVGRRRSGSRPRSARLPDRRTIHASQTPRSFGEARRQHEHVRTHRGLTRRVRLLSRSCARGSARASAGSRRRAARRTTGASSPPDASERPGGSAGIAVGLPKSVRSAAANTLIGLHSANVAQHRRQAVDRHERVRDERQREDDDEHDALGGVGRAHEQPEQRAEPRASRRRTAASRPKPPSACEQVGVDAPADDQAGDGRARSSRASRRQLGEQVAEQVGRARHRQRAEAVDDALAEVGRDRDRRAP